MHSALRQAGVDSWMLVADKYTSDRTVIGSTNITGSQKVFSGIRQSVEYWPLKRYRHKKSGAFSPAIYPSKIAAQVEAINPDIINLHWVAGGLLRPHDLRHFKEIRQQKGQGQKQRPLVWTMRDMWPFTGGCHYAGDCTAYQTHCGQCPALGSAQTRDLAYRGWQRKQSAWQDLEITLAPLSEWLADCARSSGLFAHRQIQVIANAVDIEKFRPIEQAIARHLLNLPTDKKLILFGALNPTADPRKGFGYLKAALHHLAADPNHQQFEAVIFGADKPAQDLDLKLPTTFLGRLQDDTMLALAYAAADVMVMPSIQDCFAKTPLEAMACGTPVVAFNATGVKDCLVHQRNGYAAACFEATNLARGIAWVLADKDRWQILSKNARQTVEDKFSLTRQAKQYQQLYHSLLSATHSQ
jgi:glycosyltransferase involved in cell wall biosynthesis